MIDPIYKTKEGQQVTKKQLLASGYSEERISKGLANGILSQIGDTEARGQTFKTKDGQIVNYEQLIGSGYSEEKINKGIENGILVASEDVKKKDDGTGGVDLKTGAEETPQFKLPLQSSSVEIDLTDNKIKSNRDLELQTNSFLSSIGIDAGRLQTDEYVQQVTDEIFSKKKSELDALEKQYPIKKVQKVSGRTGYWDNERTNSFEYGTKKSEINKKYADIQNKIGISKAFEFAKQNPAAAPIKIGEQWLKHANPDTYKLWDKSEKRGAINRDIAEVGVRALYATGDTGAAQLAKGDEETLDDQYPDKIITETYHRLGAELYKDQNWLFNRAPTVKHLDKAAEQLPEKYREVYKKHIRDVERRNIGTDVPMSGLLNKAGEGVASTAIESWKGLGDLVGVRSDKKVAYEALNEGYDTDFADVGTFAPAKQRLSELKNKQQSGATLSRDEIAEKQDLETYTGVRSTAQEIIDGTGNLTGQVVFQALGTKGLGATLGAATKGTGLLKLTQPVTGLATEEAIAARALDFGISKAAITDISAMAVAFASSYDAAKRDAFRLMPDDKDAGKRSLFATIVGGLNAGTERIFKDEKILNAFNKEISPNIKSLVDKLAEGKISQEALATELSTLLKNSGVFAGQMTKENTKEAIEEFSTSVGESVATSILAPTKFNERDAFNDAVSTFTTTFLHGGLVAGLAGIKGYRANHIGIPTLSQLGVNNKLTEDTKSFMNAQLLNGNMTQDEYNEKFMILNHAVKINKDVMPQVNDIEPNLSQKAKEKYGIQLLNERLLKEQAEKSSEEVLKQKLEGKIIESEKIRKQIIDKEIFVDDDYSVKTSEEIVGEIATTEEGQVVVTAAADVPLTQEKVAEQLFTTPEQADKIFSDLMDNNIRPKGFNIYDSPPIEVIDVVTNKPMKNKNPDKPMSTRAIVGNMKNRYETLQDLIVNCLSK